jgi:type IV secretion system protein VirB9
MTWHALPACVIALAATSSVADQRLLSLPYASDAVVDVPVKRGVVTLIELAADETIAEVATGHGADCGQTDSSWCVTAQAGGRRLFVKPRTTAKGPTNLTVVSDRRVHAFRLVPLADGNRQEPVYRLTVLAPPPSPPVVSTSPEPTSIALAPLPVLPTPEPARLAERLDAAPQVMNTAYSLAEGEHAADIVPSLVFDDGRFTYLRFANNREVPAVFHVLRDGSETLVNTRMEGELLVVDRVSRRLTLRAGCAVVGVWNDAFDADGVPPAGGTTVPGVARVPAGTQEIEP